MNDASEWHRLSVREGRRPVPELQEGFTPQATRSLIHWLEGELGYRSTKSAKYDQLVLDVALVCGLSVDPKQYEPSAMRQLINLAAVNDDVMVDVLDATLQRGYRHAPEVLMANLRDAQSVWTVRDDGRALVRRVNPATAEAFREAASPEDAASAQLQEAWSRLYGVAPDYSDAWDHAIKAMEAVLVPIAAPNNKRATLGTVIVELAKAPKFAAFDLGPVVTLAETLRFAWPNPDRHEGGDTRTPERAETAGVVHLAVTVVQWCRDGIVRRID